MKFSYSPLKKAQGQISRRLLIRVKELSREHAQPRVPSNASYGSEAIMKLSSRATRSFG